MPEHIVANHRTSGSPGGRRTAVIMALVTLVATLVSTGASSASAASSRPDTGGRSTQAVLKKAFNAAGGVDVLSEVETIRIEAVGTTQIRFEGFAPEEVVDTSSYSRTYSVDRADDMIRVDTTRQPLFEGFRFLPEEQFTIVANSAVGYLSDQAVFVPPGDVPTQYVTALGRQQMLFNPQSLLMAAVEDPEIATSDGIVILGGAPHRVFVFDNDVAPIRLHINQRTGLISKLTTTESSPLTRDVEIEVDYFDWQTDSALAYPSRVELLVDGVPVWEETRSSFTINEGFPAHHFADLALADPTAYNADQADFGRQSQHHVMGFFEIGFMYSAVNPVAGPITLVPGVHLLASTANTVVVEQSDGLVVLEAPTSPFHTSNVIDLIEEIWPDQSITHLIQSHHHIDHAAGVRSYVSAGADIVTGPGVGELYQDVLAASSTIRPDALAATPADAVIHEVAEASSLTLVDETNVVTSYHIADPHARDMLITAIDNGEQIVVVNADNFNGGFGLSVVLDGPTTFFDGLRSVGLIDDQCDSELPMTIMSIHGFPITLETAITEAIGLGFDIGC